MMNKEVKEAIYELSIQTDKEITYQDEINGYVSTIQNYIDKLEKEKELLIDLYTEEHQVKGDISFKLFKTEKALDKACAIMTGRVNIDCGEGNPTLNFTQEDWKEWLKNDGKRIV